jgi:tRNA 2-(methylsulfanyl)-N6-isopentenyladenosine37 hydroxylase
LKLRVDIKAPSTQEWMDYVLKNFSFFLQVHVNCERKASAMATSFVAKYPDRNKIMPILIDTAIEELEHFGDVYDIKQKKNISLTHEIDEDLYLKELIALSRTGRDERFMDRLILASIIECRGAERFRKVYENIEDADLKAFYNRL